MESLFSTLLWVGVGLLFGLVGFLMLSGLFGFSDGLLRLLGHRAQAAFSAYALTAFCLVAPEVSRSTLAELRELESGQRLKVRTHRLIKTIYELSGYHGVITAVVLGDVVIFVSTIAMWRRVITLPPPPVPPAPPARMFLADRLGAESGPFPAEAVKQLWRKGRLNDHVSFRAEESQEWRPVAELVARFRRESGYDD